MLHHSMTDGEVVSNLKCHVDQVTTAFDDFLDVMKNNKNIIKDDLKALADRIVRMSQHAKFITNIESLSSAGQTSIKDVLECVIFTLEQRITDTDKVLLDFNMVWLYDARGMRHKLYFTLCVLEAFLNHQKKNRSKFEKLFVIIRKYRKLLDDQPADVDSLNRALLTELKEINVLGPVTPVLNSCGEFLNVPKRYLIAADTLKSNDCFPKHNYVNTYFIKNERKIIWQRQPGQGTNEDYWSRDWKSRQCLVRNFLFYQCPRRLIEPNFRGQIGLEKMCPPIYAKCKSDYGVHWSCTKMSEDNINQEANLPEWVSQAENYLPLSYIELVEANTVFEREEIYTEAKLVIYCLLIKTDYPMPTRAQQPYPVQCYIGKATNGVLDRWVTSSTSHCREARKMFNGANNEESYFDLVESVPLVDEYLALSHIWNFDTTLIILSKHETAATLSQAEGEMIRLFRATEMIYGLNKQEPRSKK